MSNLKEKILADAKSRNPQYADRLEIVGPQTEGLPAGLAHYSIKITKLFDYVPINYIVIGEDYFTSLQKGDFVRLLERLRLIEERKVSAADLTALFLLIEYPSRDRHLVEKVEDISLPPVPEETREKLVQTIAPPQIQSVDGVECVFYCFNIRTRSLERFRFRIAPNYVMDGESKEIMNFREK